MHICAYTGYMGLLYSLFIPSYMFIIQAILVSYIASLSIYRLITGLCGENPPVLSSWTTLEYIDEAALDHTT